MAMISVSVSAYNPHNHRFQGISGTRQMDGYQGPIMSLGCRVKELDIIDSLISDLAEKAFLIGEAIPKNKNKEFFDRFNRRFRFLTKYIQKYYRKKSEKSKSKRFPEMNPAKIFVCLLELNKHPNLKSLVFGSKKLAISESDLSTSFTIVDKLLLLYEKTYMQVVKFNNEFCSLHAKNKGSWPYGTIEKRFWEFTDNMDFASVNNMAELVHDRIQKKDLDYLIFRKVFKTFIRKEINFSIPKLSDDVPDDERIIIIRAYKKTLKQNLNKVRSYLEKLVYEKPYKMNFLQAFDDEVIKSL